MWTKFFDMSSGGSTKVKVDGKWKDYIYIELPQEDAARYFERRFNRDPYNVTCDCCGPDYSIDEYTTLVDASKNRFGENEENVLIISNTEIEQP